MDILKYQVNILGTVYNVVFADEERRPKLINSDGYMDNSIKEIVIRKFEPDENSVEDLKEYAKKVLRHEIIHAFFYESGLWNHSGCSDAWGQDETITDWFAIQSPKMFKAFQECDCL